MKYEEVILDLVDRIKRNEVVFFLGAGASCDPPANLPVSMSIVRELTARIALPSLSESKDEVANRIAKGVRFEVFIQSLSAVLGPKVIDALDILDTGRPNFNHDFIATLAVHRLTPFVLTTNFDSLLEKALAKRACDFDSLYLDGHYRRFPGESGRFSVLKLHGSLRNQMGVSAHSSIVVSAKQVGRPVPRAKGRALREILRRYDVVFLGYSGLDDFDFLPIFLTTKSDKAIFWIQHEPLGNIECLQSADLRAGKAATLLNNPERVVATRRNGALVRCLTHEFVSMLSKHLFGKKIPKPRLAGRVQDFRYLDDWGVRTGLPKHKLYINGLMFQKLEDHQEAARFFAKVPSDSPFSESALYHKAVSLRHSNQIAQARDLLKDLAAPDSASRSTRLKVLVQLGLLETEQKNLNLARRHLSQALRMKPDDGPTVLAARANLGMYYLIEAERVRLSGETSSRVRRTVQKALHHLNLARKLVGRDGDPRTFANISGNLGLAYVFLRQFCRAERNLFEALRLFRSLYVASEEASCLDNISFYYKERAVFCKENSGQYRINLIQALKFSRRAHSLKQRVSTPRRIAIAKHSVGEVYHLLGKNQEALQWLVSAMTIFRAEGLEHYCDDVARTIGRVENALSK